MALAKETLNTDTAIPGSVATQCLQQGQSCPLWIRPGEQRMPLIVCFSAGPDGSRRRFLCNPSSSAPLIGIAQAKEQQLEPASMRSVIPYCQSGIFEDIEPDCLQGFPLLIACRSTPLVTRSGVARKRGNRAAPLGVQICSCKKCAGTSLWGCLFCFNETRQPFISCCCGHVHWK